MRLFLIIILTLLAGVSVAQSKKRKKSEAQNSPTTVDPYHPKQDYAPKAKKSSAKGPTYESEERYYERLAQLDKTRRKNEKLQEKPQYSDPSYFGHKRPPKKRKPGKMKYCRECGIRH